DQRGGGGQRLGDGGDADERAPEQRHVGGDDVVGALGQDDDEGADHQRREHGEQRHQDDRPPVDVGRGDALHQRPSRPRTATGYVDVVGGGDLFFLGHATCPAM